MIDAAKLALHDAVPADCRVGVLSVSGGAGVMLADALESAGLGFPAFRPETSQALSAVIPDYSKPHNPVDLTANVLANTGMFRKALAVIGSAVELDACILFIGLMQSISKVLTESILAARAESGRPFIVVWIGARPETVARLNAARIPVYADIPQAVTALTQARRAIRGQAQAVAIVDAPARSPPAKTLASLSEWESKAKLREMGGLSLPAGAMVRSADEVAATLVGMRAPFVAKLQSPDMPHKSEHGGVILALADPGAVATAVATLLARGREARIACDGVLIEEMVKFDLELIAGLRRDPVFGAILMVGRGGVEVELSPDVAMGLLPLSPNEVSALLRSLRCAQLFQGFRGRPPVDVAAIARILSGVGDQFLADPTVNEIEINPLAARGPSLVALDALIKVSA